MNNIWVWFAIYIVGAIASYIFIKIIDRYEEKTNGYHSKDATEQYANGLLVFFSWIGIAVIIIAGIVYSVKLLIDKIIFKEEDE